MPTQPRAGEKIRFSMFLCNFFFFFVTLTLWRLQKPPKSPASLLSVHLSYQLHRSINATSSSTNLLGDEAGRWTLFFTDIHPEDVFFFTFQQRCHLFVNVLVTFLRLNGTFLHSKETLFLHVYFRIALVSG